MKSKSFIFEFLHGEKTEVFILRDGRGKVINSTTNVESFLDFIRNFDSYDLYNDQQTKPDVEPKEDEENV